MIARRVTPLILVLLAAAHLCMAEQEQFSPLQFPASFEPPNIIKVFPSQYIYAFSTSQARMLVFDVNGKPVRDLSVLENRHMDVKYHFFDYHVDAQGRCYILAIWRDAPQRTHSGLFIYDAEGKFEQLLVFGKHVDGRRLLMDAKGHFIVLGLNGDYYFGRTTRLFILHRYNRAGDYLGSFFEVNPTDYMPPNARSISAMYAALRPLVDRLPVGYETNDRLFAVIPGTWNIQLFDAGSLQPREVINLQGPQVGMPDPAGLNPGGRLVAADLNLHAVHIDSASIIADFIISSRYEGPNTLINRRFRATYRRSDSFPLSTGPITADDGMLIQRVGIPGAKAYTYLPEKKRLQVLR